MQDNIQMAVPADVAIESAFRQAGWSFDNKSMFKAKILVLGPCQSGKSVLSNFLADASESASGDYQPTQGVRILEFEAGNLKAGNRSTSAEVELWDCSGDKKFEGCWPAIARDTNGIVFVYSPEQPNHDKDLELWYDYFVQQQGVRESCCIVFAHHRSNNYDPERPTLPGPFRKMQCIHTNIEDEGETVRREFTNFLSTLLGAMSDKRDQEELSIMNQR
ncbi:intraflagellar transport protein 22 homolog [Liolophura sinensis]|uniref:intraflagellar transport protein 22 homolog n=1 Tax=Liolophura sinensis TaxID=3198878 RepID=UPI003158DAF3